jgi:hypothetical protein
MAGWHKSMWVVERADVNFDNRPDVAAVALPSQRCAAFIAKRPADVRRRLVDIARCTAEGHLIGLESYQCANPGTTVFATALTMTMANNKGVTFGHVSYCAAHTATSHCNIVTHFATLSTISIIFS